MHVLTNDLRFMQKLLSLQTINKSLNN